MGTREEGRAQVEATAPTTGPYQTVPFSRAEAGTLLSAQGPSCATTPLPHPQHGLLSDQTGQQVLWPPTDASRDPRGSWTCC